MHRLAPLVAALGLAACKKDEPPAAPPPPVPGSPPVAMTVVPEALPPAIDAAAPADAAAGKITISIQEPRPPGSAVGQRCTLEGDPLAFDCVGAGSLAATPDGAVYVTDATGVRRYRRSPGEGCALALDASFGGGHVAYPARAPKPQTLGKGPVYMSSGGPQWTLTAAGKTVYAHDYLRGVWRVDRGKAEAVCPDLQGARDLAIVGGKAVIAREGGQRVALGGACKATPWQLEPRPSFHVHAVGDDVWGEVDKFLVRYGKDGKEAARAGNQDAFAPGGLCAVRGVAACGDDLCVLDGNCPKLARYTRDGAFVLQREVEDLIEPRPYGLAAIAAGPDGGAWLLATQKDGDTCEGAVYWIPGAAIAP